MATTGHRTDNYESTLTLYDPAGGAIVDATAQALTGDVHAIHAAIVDGDGNQVTSFTQTPSGRSVSYEDANFTSGDSPATHDVNSDLGRNGRDGYIVNDGSGDFTVEVSDNGTDYGGTHTIKKSEIFYLEGVDIDSIRITHSGTDSAYRISVI